MRIHHLNCGSFCPHGRRLVNGEGGLLEQGTAVCHCLAIETDGGIVLVDTGFGSDDARDPARLGTVFRALMRPRPRQETTAAAQIEELGLSAGDVTRIVTTRLDRDHAGGLGDFPEAEVHVLAAELAAARSPRLSERLRYLDAQWAHGPRWVEHEGGGGDDWLGFESVRILPGLDAEILLVPLAGHSRGHTGVAIESGDGWALHCGDAYFHREELASPSSCPPMLRLFQRLTAVDNDARLANRERLRQLAAAHGDTVHLFSSHDPSELERVAVRPSASRAATG